MTPLALFFAENSATILRFNSFAIFHLMIEKDEPGP
jgi:hypothetical protein